MYFIQILAKFHSFSFTQQIKSQMKGRTHRREGTCTDLNHTVVDRCVLLLSQHYQGDDNDSRYDDTSYHQANNSTLVRADVFGEENLTCKRERRKKNVTNKKKKKRRDTFHYLLVERILSLGKMLK